jgi:hypothetical protein
MVIFKANDPLADSCWAARAVSPEPNPELNLSLQPWMKSAKDQKQRAGIEEALSSLKSFFLKVVDQRIFACSYIGMTVEIYAPIQGKTSFLMLFLGP